MFHMRALPARVSAPGKSPNTVNPNAVTRTSFVKWNGATKAAAEAPGVQRRPGIGRPSASGTP